MDNLKASSFSKKWSDLRFASLQTIFLKNAENYVLYNYFDYNVLNKKKLPLKMKKPAIFIVFILVYVVISCSDNKKDISNVVFTSVEQPLIMNQTDSIAVTKLSEFCTLVFSGKINEQDLMHFIYPNIFEWVSQQTDTRHLSKESMSNMIIERMYPVKKIKAKITFTFDKVLKKIHWDSNIIILINYHIDAKAKNKKGEILENRITNKMLAISKNNGVDWFFMQHSEDAYEVLAIDVPKNVTQEIKNKW